MPDGVHTVTIDMADGWGDEAKSRGVELVSRAWSNEAQGWNVTVRDARGRVHEGVIPLVPGGPLQIRYQFASFCHGIATADEPDPPEMRFYGRNLLHF